MLNVKKDFLLFFSNIKNLDIKKSKLIFIFSTMIFSNCIQLINPLLFGKIIDGVVEKSIPMIKINIIYMILFFLLSMIISYVNSILLLNVTTKLEINAKEKVFKSILEMPYSNFLNINKGTLINNIEEDSSVFSNLFSTNIDLIIDIINMIISFFLMLYVSPHLTIILLITFPIIGCIYLFTGNKIKLKETEYKNNNDSYICFLNETMYGWKYLKLFNAESKRNNIFKSVINKLCSIQISKVLIQIKAGISINSVTFIANTINIIIGIYFIFKGTFTLGMLTAFNSYAETFKSSSLSIAQLSSIIQETCVSLFRVENILSYSKHENSEDIKYTNLDEKISNIKIDNLSYENLEGNKIFENFNMTFEKNNIYVIKGESGSGKTTLFNIISKFINTYTGKILLNEVSLSNISTKDIRSKISYVTQDNFLYSESIYDNVALYRNIPICDVMRVCKSLNIHDTIMSLPNQYDTIIHENGTDLSGGERQRICIARSIVDNPDVYLFDEITSAIDEKNTSELLNIIEDISMDSIVILTSHENLKFSVPIVEYHLDNKVSIT
ncbi:MAG: ABC transporter transmembrane domain-containing protein [Paraclostridium sp.]